jgi:superoxide dismutase
MIDGTDEADASLEDIIMSAEGGKFNNAAQVWNHTCYWNSMKPGGGGAPTGSRGRRDRRGVRQLRRLPTQFKAAAVGQFGSGWAWLVLDGGKLAIMATGNADLPMKHGKQASSRATCGSTRTTSTTATVVPTTSTPSSTTSSTGRSSRPRSADRPSSARSPPGASDRRSGAPVYIQARDERRCP